MPAERDASMVHQGMSSGWLIAALCALLLGAGAEPLPASAAQATPVSPLPVASCSAEALPSDDQAGDRTLKEGLPDGFALHVLAAADADLLPAAPAFLQLTRLMLGPGAGSETRMAGGPILFYVETGAITIYVDGTPAPVAAADSLLVPSSALYAVANEGNEESVVLRLAVVPQAADGQIMVMPTAASILPVPPTGTPRSEPLYSAEVTLFPVPGARLFLACLAWATAGAELGDRAYPGTIGLRVERGTVQIDDALTLDVGGCTLLEGQSAHRITAIAELPVVMVFGVIPAGQALWSGPVQGAVGPPPAPARLRCGG